MCGLAGIIDRVTSREVLRDKASRMVDTIRHRGPDGKGVIVTNDGVALGHARLAILDLTASADQPMTSVTGQTSIVFNGEIYNYGELRKELVGHGFTFKTRSDTEVLLNAYECWGKDFVSRLNGMFAFALYDSRNSSVLLARDRLGIKPLYYFANRRKILFASEIKAICSVLDYRPEIDREAIAEYLAFQNNYGSRTMVEGVSMFPAGSLALLRHDSLEIKFEQYWTAQIAATSVSSRLLRQELAQAIQESVDRQLEADVPVNSFLSGGIDSCAIAATAAARAGRIKTFTCGFDLTDATAAELAFDERRRAELMSRTIGSEHYEVVLKEDDFIALMDDWAWYAEEPRVGSNFPNYAVSRLASKFTKVCLSGTGGDELFGGYPWRYAAALDATSTDDFCHRYYSFWSRMVSQEHYADLIAPIAGEVTFDPVAAFRERLENCGERAGNDKYSLANSALLFELETFLHGLLVAEDKASMAHGLEIRVPLLDNRLVDLALATPFEEKVEITHSTTSGSVYGKGSAEMPSYTNGKKILREVLAHYVPEQISSARKQGFSPPFETWFRKKMSPWISSEVFSNKSPIADLLDMEIATSLWREHLTGQANHRLFVWGMIALHQFATRFLRGFN